MVDGEFLEALVDEIGDPLVSWTVCGEIAVWNRAAERLLGYAAHEVIGRNAGVVIPAELMDEHASLHAYLTQGGSSAELDTYWRHASGDRIEVSLSMSRISSPFGEMRGVGCVIRPVSPTAQLIDGLRRRAHTDAVTGALNRAGIEELMMRPDAGNPAAHRALIFIDLDGFKQVNDQAGHRNGDLLLRSCAERIKTRLPAGHALARWGGDEFVVLLEGLPDHEAAALQLTEITCNTLLFALRLSYHLGSRRYSCPASIGACVYQPQKTSAGVALEIADRAMYEVKAEGKDSCLVRGAPDSASARRAQPRVA
jgi:diguanylate cyclase (GGDEF)-like protein/PAS domain S-box-containing protein